MNSGRYEAAVAGVMAIGLAVSLPIRTSGATVGSPCAVLGNSERSRIVDYVKKKYKLPPAAPVGLSEESFVGSTCFRKLHFKSTDPKRNFQADLFLSPDLRFLTHELLDSNVDPVVEEQRKAQALAAGLITGSFPSRGQRDAKVVLTVFSDFQCSYCARMAALLTKEVLPAEKRTTRLVFRHFPLSMHIWALAAAQATECAREQNDDYFWRLHDFIFERQREFTTDNVIGRVSDEAGRYRGFDSARFASCVGAKKTAAKVEADLAFGNQIGISGTPTLYINGEPAGNIAAPEQLRTLIREALAKSSRAAVPSR